MRLPSFASLVEMLACQARLRADEVALIFGEQPWTFGQLWQMSLAQAARLRAAGIMPGDRVIISIPNGPSFFASFYGCQLSGAIPVPIFPGSGVERARTLARLCAASAIVAPPNAAAGERVDHRGHALISSDPEPGASAPGSWHRPQPEDLAWIQYTSGSTGDPKGVMISHQMAMINVSQMIEGMEIMQDDRFVSWLPAHHDMGLVLMTIVPFSIAARLVLLPASLVSVRPWLEAISRHRGTFTAAPDFAYRLCLRTVRDASRLDLSSLRVALNAAEPVRASTLERFEDRFDLTNVMAAGYGLAEATVGVSMQPPGTPAISNEQGLVAIGRAFPGIELEVADGDHPAEPGRAGELLVSSPSNTRGYWDNPEATQTLHARPGWIRTGDQAVHTSGGELFVVGRLKNIIIQGGRNLAPSELEETVEALPFVRRAAAVGIDRGRSEGEQAHVFIELRKAQPPPHDRLCEMAIDAVSSIQARLGLRPGRVCLLRPRSIPLTANGKIRYPELRSASLDGSLVSSGAMLYPPRVSLATGSRHIDSKRSC